MIRRIRLILPMMTVLLACTACESVEDIMPPVVVHTPLEFDPTDEYDLPAWWTNGKQMLHLDPDGGYALYASLSRYRLPFERGRWSQTSWTALRLAPYDRLPREPVRAAIEMVEDRMMLSVPRYERMSAIGGPPQVPEDDLLGAWSGEGGALALGADGRYAFSPAPTGPTAPVMIAGHRGRWILDGEMLRLEPAPPNMRAIALRVVHENDETRLVTRDLDLRRGDSDANES